MSSSSLPENVISIAGRGGFGGEGVSPSPPKNLLYLPEKDEANGKTGIDEEQKDRPRNKVWDACVEVLGYGPATDSEKRLWGRMTTSLNRAGATDERVIAVAHWYRKTWPGIDLTITAIEKWYSHFLRLKEQREAAPTPGCPDCGMRRGLHTVDCSAAETGPPSLDGFDLAHPEMQRGVACVRQWAVERTDDQIFADLRTLYAGHPTFGDLEVSRLLSYAGVIRATASLHNERR